jgi:exodeoxyribonuclease VII large subunit
VSELDFSEMALEVSDFVALVNQTFEYAFPVVTIRGELMNFKVSKNKWVYFDLKDAEASVRFFGTVYQLNGPLEDGMILRVQGTPRLHPQYGFSVTIVSLRPEGEGALKRAAELLQAQLAAEGLFDDTRKRSLPYPPARIGLITSTESAAYADFTKIISERWRGLVIECIDVQVQGEAAPEQIVQAIEHFGQEPSPPDVLVLIRGGGNADDLYAFNTEHVTRTVASSRVPTLVAIGHEVDVSLAELAADRRASTPSNAAELLVPDRRDVLRQLEVAERHLREAMSAIIDLQKRLLIQASIDLGQSASFGVERLRHKLLSSQQLLEALNPRAVLARGYALVRLDGKKLVRRTTDVKRGAIVTIELSDGNLDAAVR